MPNLLIVHSPAEDWPNACRLVNFLLREGAEVRWATAPFRASGIDGDGQNPMSAARSWLRTPVPFPSHAWMRLDADTRSPRTRLVEDVSGFVGLPLRRLRIAMYGGGGAPFNHARIFAELGFDKMLDSSVLKNPGRQAGGL